MVCTVNYYLFNSQLRTEVPLLLKTKNSSSFVLNSTPIVRSIKGSLVVVLKITTCPTTHRGSRAVLHSPTSAEDVSSNRATD